MTRWQVAGGFKGYQNMSNNNNNNNNMDDEEEEVESAEELKRTMPGNKMVSPTTAIVVGLVAGLVAWTGKGWKEVRRFFLSVFRFFTVFHSRNCIFHINLS